MRSKNARAIDPEESAHLALVKSCACVFCDTPAPSEAHHVKQGRHYATVATCKNCHDSKAWRIGHPNEFDAINETLRRVARLRAGQPQKSAPQLRSKPAAKRGGSSLSSDKILKHRSPEEIAREQSVRNLAGDIDMTHIPFRKVGAA
jgi:hypothetical protein